MSIYQDYFPEIEFDRTFPFGVPCNTWTTKDGREIPLKEMTTSHIKNCIKFLEEIPYADGWVIKFEEELKERKLRR